MSDLDFSVEYDPGGQTFRQKVVGVTFDNPDGMNRQVVIKQCQAGQSVRLVREPDNPHDPRAVAVYDMRGRQMGYLPSDQRLAQHLDSGGRYTARIIERTGGSGKLGMAFGRSQKNYGCNLEITKTGHDSAVIEPFRKANEKIERLLDTAKAQEKPTPDKAIDSYRLAIAYIRKLDSTSPIAKEWRYARYPINRLSLVLERARRFEEALGEIQRFEAYADHRAIPQSEAAVIEKRKQRLERKV